MNQESGTRKRIVLAVISIMEREGASGITVRRIAREAGVNTAAVNYHFGTKANLIDFVLKSTLGHAFADWSHVIETEGLSPGIRLLCLLNLVMEGVSRFPGLVETHLFDPAIRKEARHSFSVELQGFLDLLGERFAEHVPAPPGVLRLCLAQMLTAAIAGALFPELLKASAEPGSEPDRERYIANLILRFTGIDPSPSPGERLIMEGMFAMAFGGSDIGASREP